MKIAPTLEGGIRIDPESPEDWYILRMILRDARGAHTDLADRLGKLVTHKELSDDWKDLVVPDLREAFEDQLDQINATIEAAFAFSKAELQAIWITRDDALVWYGALNQARLAIEYTYQFGDESDVQLETMSPVNQEAFMRSRFYCALQSFILDHSLP